MLIAGIAGRHGNLQTANLINNLLSSTGKKISVIDSKNLLGANINRIKAYVSEVEKNKTDILLLKININNVERFLSNDIHFDIMIFPGNLKEGPEDGNAQISEGMEKVFLLLAKKGTAIVNVDDSELIKMFQGMKHNVVTYGFNTKASVTTSSIGDILFKDGFICCQQEPISARNGTLMEPQEYKLKLDAGELDIHEVLAAASFAIVNGVDLNNMS
ncbi:MAG: glutamate ligase [Ruminiclostridium sp.]|nr:glutamate ligase [Ruminiclostridium sp.]